jgi:hypothetical protein
VLYAIGMLVADPALGLAGIANAIDEIFSRDGEPWRPLTRAATPLLPGVRPAASTVRA